MATVTGTSSTYSVGTGGGNREDLEDKIWDLFPMETWALTNLEKVSAEATLHEWLSDELDAPGDNAQLEGDDASFTTITNAARYGNRTQILRKTFLISRTQEKIKKAGRARESARQAMKKMREWKRDAERAITRNAAATAGAAASARVMGGMESWIGATAASATAATAVVLSTTTASATTAPLTSGSATAAPTDGSTTGAFVKASLDFALQAAWEQGGDTDVILLSAARKKDADAFTSIVTRNIDIGRTDQAVLTGAQNVYVSSYGVHKLVQHRYMRESVALILDSSMWATAWIDRPFTEQLAKTGDATKHQIIGEFTLVARNWKANSKVVALA